jgi:hypothetical protein
MKPVERENKSIRLAVVGAGAIGGVVAGSFPK